MKRKYADDVLDSAYLGMKDLYDNGTVDEATMRRFEKLCQAAVEEFPPEAVKALRQREKASQALLAKRLAVSVQTVSLWERGLRKPEGPALALLTLARVNGLDYIKR